MRKCFATAPLMAVCSLPASTAVILGLCSIMAF